MDSPVSLRSASTLHRRHTLRTVAVAFKEVSGAAVGEPARDLNHKWYCKAYDFSPVRAKTTFRDSYCKCMFGHMQSICVRFAITCLCIVFVCFFTCIISGKDLHAPQARIRKKTMMRAELEQLDFLSLSLKQAALPSSPGTTPGVIYNAWSTAYVHNAWSTVDKPLPPVCRPSLRPERQWLLELCVQKPTLRGQSGRLFTSFDLQRDRDPKAVSMFDHQRHNIPQPTSDFDQLWDESRSPFRNSTSCGTNLGTHFGLRPTARQIPKPISDFEQLQDESRNQFQTLASCGTKLANFGTAAGPVRDESPACLFTENTCLFSENTCFFTDHIIRHISIYRKHMFCFQHVVNVYLPKTHVYLPKTHVYFPKTHVFLPTP